MASARVGSFVKLSIVCSLCAAVSSGRANEPAKSDSKGSLSAGVIRNVIRVHMAEVRRCYVEGLQQKPQLSGKVIVQWTIETSGGVSHARVTESTLQHEPTERCIASAVNRWSFPKPTGGSVNVTYPFLFQSDGETPGAEVPAKRADPLAPR